MEKPFGSSTSTASPPSLRRGGHPFYFMAFQKPATTSVTSWNFQDTFRLCTESQVMDSTRAQLWIGIRIKSCELSLSSLRDPKSASVFLVLLVVPSQPQFIHWLCARAFQVPDFHRQVWPRFRQLIKISYFIHTLVDFLIVSPWNCGGGSALMFLLGLVKVPSQWNFTRS